MAGFIWSMLLVTVAELGDKTQLLVLSFATKYRPLPVMLGVAIALLFLQLIAVTIGQTLFAFIPMRYLQIIVGLSFIGFGIWTLKKDDSDEESADVEANKQGPALVAAIALTFFIAELGDKTQLATISLAAKYNSFYAVWLGSTAGMLIADGLAVAVGMFAGKRLPRDKIRYISSGIFILFGIITLGQTILSWA